MNRRLLKKLDLYIIRKFLATFIVTLFLFVVIIMLFDIGEKLDDFLEKNAPVRAVIFDYYLNYIPYFLNTFSPVFIFVAVIYFTSRLAMRSEFISCWLQESASGEYYTLICWQRRFWLS